MSMTSTPLTRIALYNANSFIRPKKCYIYWRLDAGNTCTAILIGRYSIIVRLLQFPWRSVLWEFNRKKIGNNMKWPRFDSGRRFKNLKNN